MGNKIRVIDLFAGCGGLTKGFDLTGQFESVEAVEFDRHAAATYAANFPSGNVFAGDIADWVGTSNMFAEVVVGGPPCQGFSALGKQDPDDPRNKLWRHYVEVLETVRPAFFVLENVPQFLKSAEFQSLQRMTRRGGELDAYDLQPELLVSTDFGAGQARKRVVVIGRLKGTRAVDLEGRRAPAKTLREVIPVWMDEPVQATALPSRSRQFGSGSVPGDFTLHELHITRNPTELSLSRYRHIPPGGNRTHLPDHLLSPCWRNHTSGSGDVMGRLSWHKPSVTIRTEFFKPEKGRYLHPEQHRPITHAEAALIQGFPEDFVWCGTKTSIARQIGNAVPPPLAQAIGQAIADRIG